MQKRNPSWRDNCLTRHTSLQDTQAVDSVTNCFRQPAILVDTLRLVPPGAPPPHLLNFHNFEFVPVISQKICHRMWCWLKGIVLPFLFITTAKSSDIGWDTLTHQGHYVWVLLGDPCSNNGEYGTLSWVVWIREIWDNFACVVCVERSADESHLHLAQHILCMAR